MADEDSSLSTMFVTFIHFKIWLKIHSPRTYDFTSCVVLFINWRYCSCSDKTNIGVCGHILDVLDKSTVNGVDLRWHSRKIAVVMVIYFNRMPLFLCGSWWRWRLFPSSQTCPLSISNIHQPPSEHYTWSQHTRNKRQDYKMKDKTKSLVM